MTISIIFITIKQKVANKYSTSATDTSNVHRQHKPLTWVTTFHHFIITLPQILVSMHTRTKVLHFLGS